MKMLLENVDHFIHGYIVRQGYQLVVVNEKQHAFSGKRIGRRNRLYHTKDRHKVCADVNSAYNILRKSRPDAFAKGIAGYVVHLLQQAV